MINFSKWKEEEGRDGREQREGSTCTNKAMFYSWLIFTVRNSRLGLVMPRENYPSPH